MSQQQIVNFKLFKFLLTQLKNFGLNPADWKIDRKSQPGTNQIFLVHKKDGEFRFRGELAVNSESVNWLNLSLLSL